ncbi:putative ribosomal protein L20 [Medicago truncatula]|uniref:Large ribosomal subunit protein bL20c n=1 Tax=Medicago truncatula TaxID=3880 RepID=A0A396HJS0_MEDTR|nr:putative ribosomal protein L20 [Medicago truncatula]
MTRVKRGSIARKRRTEMSLFTSSFRGAHSKLIRTISQQKIKALVSAHRDGDRKKKGFSQFVDQSNKRNNCPK